MACLHEDEIVALLDEQLDPADHARILEHTEICETCRRWLAAAARHELEPGADGVPPDDAITVGTTIGPYEVARFVGRGATATVYAARDPRLGREVALKVVHPGDHSSALVDAEGHALARLRHRNVLTVHEVGQWHGRPYLVTELLEGQHLGDWLGAQPRSVPDVLARLVEAGRGIAAAHRAGVCHGDIKPANLVVDADGEAVVTDFGFAVLRSPGSEPEPLAHGGGGTVAFAAPERLRGAAPDEPSDQFAFGRTAQFALTRAEGRTHRAVTRALERAVSVRAEDRHGDIESLLAVLEQRHGAPRTVAVGLGFAALLAGAVFLSASTQPALDDELEAALVLLEEGSDSSAEATLRRVVARAAEVGDTAVEARGRLALATLELDRGALDQAVAQTQRIDTEHLDDAQRGAMHLVDAAVAYQRGALEEAATACRASVKSFAAAGDPRLARARFNLGSILLDLGELEEARRLFEEAKDAFADSDPHSADVGRAWHSLAAVANAMDEPTEGLAAFERAEQILARRLGADHIDTLKATFGHGNALVHLGRASEALGRYAACSRALATAEPVPPLRLYCLDSEAKALMELERSEEAAERLEEAYALVERTELGDRPIRVTIPYDLARLRVDASPLRAIELLIDARTVCERVDWDCAELMDSITTALERLTAPTAEP